MKCALALLSLFLTFSAYSQNNYASKNLIQAYEVYSEMSREVAYVHLNKSTYINGEELAFKAYVFDKETKKLNPETSNLYCVILNEKEQIIKSKLIPISNGISAGIFSIDSIFSTGSYTFKAFTNWMKNFDELNHFEQSFDVINPETTKLISSKKTERNISIQVLPEGGHFVENTINTAGIIVKTENGFGLPNIDGIIEDNEKNQLTTFKTNSLGIAKVKLNLKGDKSYYAKVFFNGKYYETSPLNIKNKGFVMELTNLKNKVGLTFRTNLKTLPEIEGKNFTLAIHNGHSAKATLLKFEDELETIIVIPNEDLYSGVNIFTVFDNKNQPVLERLFFNYSGFSLPKSKDVTVISEKDSTTISLVYDKPKYKSSNSLSISILPANTKSYQHHQNLPSYIYLRPYLKGNIENASYYFRDITLEKQVALDNLLITQGWSSYNWEKIFNHPPEYNYDFENGINVTLTSLNEKQSQFLIFPNINTDSKLISLQNDLKKFDLTGFFPFSEEKITISSLSEKGISKKPSLTLQFMPSRIPTYSYRSSTLNYKKSSIINEDDNIQGLNENGFKNLQKLEEVTITKNKPFTRIERLKNSSLGRVDVFDKEKRFRYRFLSNYLTQHGFNVEETPAIGPNGEISYFRIKQYAPNTFNNEIPLIILNGSPLSNLDILYRFSMDNVDYIEVNKSGLGYGIRGGGGVIKIATTTKVTNKLLPKANTFTEYKIPLTFSTQKKFFVPNYSNTKNKFYSDFGVINWFPNIKLDSLGNILLKVPKPDISKISLHIEGVVGEREFVSEVKVIDIK